MPVISVSAEIEVADPDGWDRATGLQHWFLGEISAFVKYGVTTSSRVEKSNQETSIASLQKPKSWQVFS
jgi:hypothetical protein